MELYTALVEMPARFNDKLQQFRHTDLMPSVPHLKLLVLLPCLISAGCATLNAGDCQEGDWEQIGENDADNGRSPDIFAQHLEACAQHGIEPDQDAWQAGYSAGLEDYCSTRGGIDAGRDGRPYNRICPPETEADFATGYRAGRDIYRANAQLTEINAQLRQYRYELQFNRSLSSELRSRYLTEVIRLEQRLSRADGDVNHYERRAEALLRETTPAPREDD